MLDGERDTLGTCTCVGMHTHAFMGSLPQTDGRLHRRTTVYDASRPGTVCGSHDCRGVYVHVVRVRSPSAACLRVYIRLDRSRGFRPVSVDEPGY